MNQPAQLNPICLADVKTEEVAWLWPDRIPRGKLSIIEGHPGVGKSTIALEVASRVSRGEALPPNGEKTHPGRVLLLTAEDGLGDTVRPRVEAAGGNLFCIHALPDIDTEEEGPRLPEIPRDVPALEAHIEREHFSLLIIDPLNAYLSDQTNSFKDHDVRRALAPLAGMAERTGCAVLVVRHLTKTSSGNAIVAGGGSIGIIGQARSAMLVAADPEDPSQMVLAVVKANLTRKPESLKFKLSAAPGERPRVEWLGYSPHSADALIAAGRDTEDSSALHEATQLLGEWLASGSRSKADIIRLARDAKLSDRTIERAKQKLGVTHRRTGFGAGSQMMWDLPSSSPAMADVREDGAYQGERKTKEHSGNGLSYSPSAVSRDPTFFEQLR